MGSWQVRRWQGAAVVAGLAGGITYIGGLVAIYALARQLPYEPEWPKGSGDHPVAIVLYDDAPEERRARVGRAVARLEAGAVSQIIMVGGYRPARHYLGSALMVEDAVSMGVDRGLLFHDTVSNDTRSNLEDGLSIARRLGADRIEIVSDRLHLVRTSWLMKRLFPEVNVGLVPSRDPESVASLLARLNHELLAYAAATVLPQELSAAILARLRNASAMDDRDTEAA
ncbi:YdcF family protein [Chelatococcus sp. SYSU_G07232]|uniref:YdcF family protein n=1 Tax=Chelatococcus albus TaxID=3047466 RepID=A0ABT7ALL1_9HYPH|nr:YdcF family protein [Chelatococcus sp. SYSU_G07232]MDJ1160274.1 YdcF family protein [Chelatococcus sp. SYSU_G07232]